MPGLFDLNTPILDWTKEFEDEIMSLINDSWRFADALTGTPPDQAHIVGEIWEKGAGVQVDRAADPAKIWREMRRFGRAGFAIKQLDGNTLLVRFNHKALVTVTWSGGIETSPEGL